MKAVQWLVFVLAAASLTGCGTRKVIMATQADVYNSQTVMPSSSIPFQPEKADKNLVACAREWLGVPYRYGGTDHDGIDCSGLTMNVYSKSRHVKLPRSSREQARACQPVSRERLQVGDLLFFATGKDSATVCHVGLYTGNGHMIHASQSRGVVECDINTPYFMRTYAGAGRVMSMPLTDNKSQIPSVSLEALINQKIDSIMSCH